MHRVFVANLSKSWYPVYFTTFSHIIMTIWSFDSYKCNITFSDLFVTLVLLPSIFFYQLPDQLCLTSTFLSINSNITLLIFLLLLNLHATIAGLVFIGSLLSTFNKLIITVYFHPINHILFSLPWLQFQHIFTLLLNNTLLLLHP